MTIENKSHQAFYVEYIRQGKANQWKVKTNKEQIVKAIDTEGVMGWATALMEKEKVADANYAKIFVSVKRDPRYFDISPELEEERIAMIGKVNQIADKEFLKRHPDAKIEHSEQ